MPKWTYTPVGLGVLYHIVTTSFGYRHMKPDDIDVGKRLRLQGGLSRRAFSFAPFCSHAKRRLLWGFV